MAVRRSSSLPPRPECDNTSPGDEQLVAGLHGVEDSLIKRYELIDYQSLVLGSLCCTRHVASMGEVFFHGLTVFLCVAAMPGDPGTLRQELGSQGSAAAAVENRCLAKYFFHDSRHDRRKTFGQTVACCVYRWCSRLLHPRFAGMKNHRALIQKFHRGLSFKGRAERTTNVRDNHVIKRS